MKFVYSDSVSPPAFCSPSPVSARIANRLSKSRLKRERNFHVLSGEKKGGMRRQTRGARRRSSRRFPAVPRHHGGVGVRAHLSRAQMQSNQVAGVFDEGGNSNRVGSELPPSIKKTCALPRPSSDLERLTPLFLFTSSPPYPLVYLSF